MKYKLFIFITLPILVGLSLVFYFKNNDYFTLIVIPDTQKYSMYNPQIFSNQTEWIAKNKNNLNIKFVSQLGDLVQSGSLVNSEWETASKSLSSLEKANIPYGIIPGNHDIDQVDASSSGSIKYNEILPLNRFNTKPWFGGNYLEYQNNYQLITAGGIDFIFMNVEVDPTDDVLKWADEILSKYKERKAIFTTHAYLQDDTGERSQKPHFRENGNPGEEIWNKVVKHNCNVFLVLSGHFHNKDGENRLVSTNDCGNPVNQVIQDYQGRENSGNGFLRIYKFYPKKHEVSVLTYSTTLKRFEWDRNSRFVLKLPF